MNNRIQVGVIGGMPVDTKFGADVFQMYGFDVTSKYICHTSKEMTRLSILEPDKLTSMVVEVVKEMQIAGVDVIILYCNTMVGAINMRAIKKSVSIPIITPQDVYKAIAKKHNKIGVIAASPTSASNTEKVIIDTNKNAIVFGYGNLEIVHDIEANVHPNKIIERHQINAFIDSASRNGAKVIILGCTHFPYFYDAIKNMVDATIIEPSVEMRNMIQIRGSAGVVKRARHFKRA